MTVIQIGAEAGYTSPDAFTRAFFRASGTTPTGYRRQHRSVHDLQAAVDATCQPPQTFTLGGVLAHVLTFAAVRRTLAIGAPESSDIDDLGAGDPMRFVGGEGSDASGITRNFE